MSRIASQIQNKEVEEAEIPTSSDLGLKGESAKIYDENRHSRQLAINKGYLLKSKSGLSKKDRKLGTKSGNYRKKSLYTKTCGHYGQRKLFDVEMEFLTDYASEGMHVVYIGGAPGTHLRALIKLFPFLTFHLYDPVKFNITMTDNVKQYNYFFTLMTALQVKYNLKDEDILFISDIRRNVQYTYREVEKPPPPEIKSNIIVNEEDIKTDIVEPIELDEETLKNEIIINEDMKQQEAWLKIINPIASLLKFRLSFASGYTYYLNGELYTQPFVGTISNEGRLVVTSNYSNKKYINKEYSERFFYHNLLTRNKIYNENTLTGCACYNCSAENIIFDNYSNRFGVSKNDIIKLASSTGYWFNPKV